MSGSSFFYTFTNRPVGLVVVEILRPCEKELGRMPWHTVHTSRKTQKRRFKTKKYELAWPLRPLVIR